MKCMLSFKKHISLTFFTYYSVSYSVLNKVDVGEIQFIEITNTLLLFSAANNGLMILILFQLSLLQFSISVTLVLQAISVFYDCWGLKVRQSSRY